MYLYRKKKKNNKIREKNDMYKRLFIIILIGLVIFSCTVTSEKYRFQKRIDSFYGLLKEEEFSCFKRADFETGGELIKKRLESDTNFYRKWKELQYSEAIAIFNPQQTLGFYYRIILRELNRAQYYNFMDLLDKELQLSFARRDNFVVKLNSLNNEKIKKFLDNLRKEYRLKNFTDEEIYNFFRNVIFIEATGKRFYHFCKFLKSLNLLYDFEQGRFDKIKEKNLGEVEKIEFDEIKKQTGLTKLSFYEFADIYYNVVMRELPKETVIQTLHKF